MIIRRSPLVFCPLFALAALVCLFLAQTVPAGAQRLPDNVRPSHYALTLAPDLNSATFTGAETIDVVLAESSDRITLNAAEIDFKTVTITADGKQQTGSVALDDSKEQATLTFPDKIPAGPATLSITYTGILNNELRGFYLSKTPRRNYAVTQFESTDARRAFPCFDEPAFKATFNVSLVVDTADTVISNTPIESDKPDAESAGKHTIKFFTTPKMSTYLVAFLVGDFKCSSGSQDGVAIRVCSTPDKVALTPYGVDVAKFMLHYYNNYFGISYPLKKLDLIGLPDFAAGAMENFGAITYRETDLLIDPKTASVDAKVRVAIVIAHEMAHQWFGDLVTMKWWDNVWLNEGFATWMENKAAAAMHPEWHMDQVVSADEDSTLNLDAQLNTRAIRAQVDTPDQIDQMFDDISYGKASDVLLTVENYLGEETFRKGVHAYLAAHLYSNATAEDFWNAQTAVSHKPVDKIMESLVAQRGEPLLTFGDPAGDSTHQVPVVQRRFFLSPAAKLEPDQKWTLPVCFKTASGQSCQILTPADSALKAPSSPLFFANAGAKGYYRSAYTPAEHAAIAAGIETSLAPTERIRFLGDEWAQLRNGDATVADYLKLAAAVHSDPNAGVLAEAVADRTDAYAQGLNQSLNGIASIYGMIAASPEQRAVLSAWIRKTYSQDYLKLGPPSASDSDNTSALRNQLFDLLGNYGKDPVVLEQARRMAQDYLQNPNSIDPTLSQQALAIAARNGDAKLFDGLQEVVETSIDPTVQENALRLLAYFQDPALVQRSLDYAASGKVRNQDAAIEFGLPFKNAETRTLAWTYIQNNWDKVHAQLAIGMGPYFLRYLSNFCSVEERDNVETFFAAHKLPESDVSLKRAIEGINGCIELRNLQQSSLDQWIAAQPKP